MVEPRAAEEPLGGASPDGSATNMVGPRTAEEPLGGASPDGSAANIVEPRTAEEPPDGTSGSVAAPWTVDGVPLGTPNSMAAPGAVDGTWVCGTTGNVVTPSSMEGERGGPERGRGEDDETSCSTCSTQPTAPTADAGGERTPGRARASAPPSISVDAKRPSAKSWKSLPKFLAKLLAEALTAARPPWQWVV